MDKPLHTNVMRKIAIRAMDDALAASGLARDGLFLMGYGPSGFTVWEYAKHLGDEETPTAFVTATVDKHTGEVTVLTSPLGHPPYGTPQSDC